MLRLITRLLAGGYGFGDRLLEAAPMVVAQKRLEVPGAPVLSAMLVDKLQLLEVLVFGVLPHMNRKVLISHDRFSLRFSQLHDPQALDAPVVNDLDRCPLVLSRLEQQGNPPSSGIMIGHGKPLSSRTA
jgi:hypothetical protein